MLAGTLVALALAADPDCRPGVASLGGGDATLQLDLDGDGVPDTVRVRRHDVIEATFTLKGLKPRQTSLMFDGYGSFDVIFPVLELPLTRGRDEALRRIEEYAFDLVCSEADPSLQRLWQQQATGRGRPMPLRWVEGPPVAPRWYTVRRGAQWVTYRGNFHGPRGTEAPWLSHVVRGDQVLIATQHGLVLTDFSSAQAAHSTTRPSSDEAGGGARVEGPTRHAWLYVTDFGIGKLRHATLSNPRFEGPVAVVDFASPLSDDFEHTTRIEVNLETGAVRVVTSKR